MHDFRATGSTRSRASTPSRSTATNWYALANRALDGIRLSAEEGLAVLNCPDNELLDLLAAAYRVRHRYFGNRVHMNFLMNAKSGHCPEDCGYCSQSKVSTADIPKYNLLNAEQVLEGARMAAERQAKTYCIVLSGRGPNKRALDQIAEIVPQIKARYGLGICTCLGLLTPDEAERLKACGVDRVNHNLNTSERFYPKICTTHTYQDRLATLRAVRAAGLEICCGGIVGMGEEPRDVVELAQRVGELEAEAVPVNFLLPIPGTPLAGAEKGDGHGDRSCSPARQTTTHRGASPPVQQPPLESRGGLNPRYCLKVLALFRLANPKCELRVAAGREVHLGPLQPLSLYAANSMFVGDYLTTSGQRPEDDYRMIEALGFEAVADGVSAPDGPVGGPSHLSKDNFAI